MGASVEAYHMNAHIIKMMAINIKLSSSLCKSVVLMICINVLTCGRGSECTICG